MWRPLDVVPEHRTRATVVWGALLLAIVGYTAWQIVALHATFDNPGTTFSVSDDLYAFPALDICLWHGMGCDEKFSLDECVKSVTATAYDYDNDEVMDIQFGSQWSNCLGFDLTKLDMQGSEHEDNSSRQTKPSTILTMSWDIDPSIEEPYRKAVGVFLGNDSAAERINVPYSRVVHSPASVSGDDTFIETALTIGRSTRNVISGVSTTSYHALTLSTVTYVNPTGPTDTKNDTSLSGRGYLHLTLTQGANSLTELSDINPLDISTLLGNIGGFWELLLVTWGICFIVSRSESPTQRGRDFTRPVQQGREIISRTRRSITQMAASDAERGGEDPYWAAERNGRPDFPGIRSTRVMLPVQIPPPPNRSASFFGRSIPGEYPVHPGSSVASSVDAGAGPVERDGLV